MAKFLSKLEKAFETALGLLTGLMVVFACYQVAARYFFGWGITWTEETMRYIFVATIMLGVYFMSKTSNFATLTIFSDLVAKKSKIGDIVLRVLQYLVQIVFYFLLFYYGVKLCMMSTGRLSTATRIPFSIIYSPLPIGGFMGFVNMILRFIREFWPQMNEKGDEKGC